MILNINPVVLKGSARRLLRATTTAESQERVRAATERPSEEGRSHCAVPKFLFDP